MTETLDDPVVETALAELAAVDPETAAAARAGFDSLTWGDGRGVVTAHGLAEFLWYQLPTKWMIDLDEKLFLAGALADLFTRLDRPRYAAMCASPTTAQILTAWDRDGDAAGFKAYRAALITTGTEPPNVTGLFEWGAYMGTDEATAYHAAIEALEHAIDAGQLNPGRVGWRRTAEQITRTFLASPHDDVTGTSWLQWVHAERFQHWANRRGATWQRLAACVADDLIHPAGVPADAEQRLAPVRWLLDHAATGAPLTETGNLARVLVFEGCERFDWFRGRSQSESDIVELWTLRELVKQMGALRRSGRKLLLTNLGKALRATDTTALWHTTAANLGDAETGADAASDVALLLPHTGDPYESTALDTAVTAVLVEQGWRNQTTGEPITQRQTGHLLGDLRRRLNLLGLSTEGWFQSPLRLTDTGRLAARSALRTRALRPRTTLL
jgi:hypothetical protein